MWDLGFSQYTPLSPALLGLARVYKWWVARSINSHQESYLSNVGLGFFPIHPLTLSTIGLWACIKMVGGPIDRL